MNITQRSAQRLGLVVLLAYAVLTMAMWGTFAFDRGLYLETIFPYRCQRSLWHCLAYPNDPFRPYNSLFLGLSYLFRFGDGSYRVYQLVYGLLFWGRGWLTFLVLRQVAPAYPLFGFLVGALVLVHASDPLLNWLGQMHQLGFQVFLLLAIYWLLRSWFSECKNSRFGYLALAISALYISLWTYEAHLFLILTVPLLLWQIRPKLNYQFMYTAVAWYALPLVYGGLQAWRYLAERVDNYQSRSISALTPELLLENWSAQLMRSLNPGRWGIILRESTELIGEGLTQPEQMARITVVIVGLVATVMLAGWWYLKQMKGLIQWPSRQFLGLAFIWGFGWLVLSFPFYLLLENNIFFIRTQMLSSFGTALMWVSGVMLLASYFRSIAIRQGLVLLIYGGILIQGVRAGLLLQDTHVAMWQVYRNVMSQIRDLAPQLRNNTIVIILGVPHPPRYYYYYPFNYENAIHYSIHLLNPGKNLIGAFQTTGLFNDSSGNKLPTKMIKLKKLGQQFFSQDCIVFRYQTDGRLTLLEQVPQELLSDLHDPSSYNPHARIMRRLPSNAAIQMLGR